MMSVRRLPLLFAVAALALVLISCRGGGDGGGAATRTPAAGAQPTPVEGKFRTVTSDDGKLTLEIPPGAADEAVEITITAVPADELPQGLQVLQGAGPGYRLEPDGLEFSEPAVVSLELDRTELEGQPEGGVTAYGLVSLTQGGEREVLDGLVTEASLGEAKVMVRGELSHLSWLGRTRGSLAVTLEQVQGEQPAGGTFTARATAKNANSSGTVTLGPTLGTFFAVGRASVPDSPYFYRQAAIGAAEEIEKSGTFECGESPGAGAYGVKVTTTSRVAVEDGEPISTRLTVFLGSGVECVAGPTPTSELPPAGEYSFTVTGTMEIEFSEAGVSAAPLILGERQVAGVEGSLTIQLKDDGSFTITDKDGVDLVTGDFEGGPITFSQNEDKPSTGKITLAGTAKAPVMMKVYLNAELPTYNPAIDEGEVILTRNEEPIELEGDGNPFSDEGATLATPSDAEPVRFAPLDEVDPILLFGIPTVFISLFGGFGFEDTDEPTPTPSPEDASPTEEPGLAPAGATIKLGFTHNPTSLGEPLLGPSAVTITGEGFQPGQTVQGQVTGEGVVGDGKFTAMVNDKGEFLQARVFISSPGNFKVTVDGVSGEVNVPPP